MYLINYLFIRSLRYIDVSNIYNGEDDDIVNNRYVNNVNNRYESNNRIPNKRHNKSFSLTLIKKNKHRINSCSKTKK